MHYFTEKSCDSVDTALFANSSFRAKLDWDSAYAVCRLTVTSWSAHCQGEYSLRVFKFISS